jgi:hypothetical protein
MSEPKHRDVHGFCQRYFNKVVLDGWQAVRLIGYAETAIDAYYVYSCPRRGVYWSSAVGGPATLEGLHDQMYVYSNGGEHWDNYTRLDGLLALNGAPPVKDFVCDIRPDDTEGFPLLDGAPLEG